MKNMLKKLWIPYTVIVLSFAMSGCGANPSAEDVSANATVKTYKTYEVETFDGKVISIDENNIISQENIDDVLETTLVPDDAKVIAPGRDFVYLADDNQYYVEDAVDNLLTIAKKIDSKEDSNNSADTKEYTTSAYSLRYDSTSIEAFEDADTDSVTFSYCNENVQTAGSNVLTFNVEKNVEAKKFLEEKVEAIDGNKSDIMEVLLTATSDTCYCYKYGGESEASGLKTEQILYAVPCGSDTIYIDGFRTIGTNEETEMIIDSAFEYIMQTFVIKE